MAGFIDLDPTPQELTLGSLKSMSIGTTVQLRSGIDHAYQQIWFNPNGLTPQQVFDLLDQEGKKASDWMVAMRQAHNAVVAAGHTIGALVPVGKSVSFDGSGKGTVTG